VVNVPKSTAIISAQLFVMLTIGQLFGFGASARRVFALPVDIPEEVIQLSIYENASSQLDGQPQSSSEQALEQQQLRIPPEEVPAPLAPKIKQTVGLLRLRKLIKSLIPFFPFL
jgi:hypothetical protein